MNDGNVRSLESESDGLRLTSVQLLVEEDGIPQDRLLLLTRDGIIVDVSLVGIVAVSLVGVVADVLLR